MKGKTFVISLGGSFIVPAEGINVEFLKKFKNLLLKHAKEGKKFFLTMGGGAVCRQYQKAAQEVESLSADELDWIGIFASRLNARLVKAALGDLAHGEIITDPSQPITTDKKVVVGAGWKPGWSTDFVAATLAEKNQADILINLSNIDYVFDKDPKKYPDAKKMENVSWGEMKKIVGDEWKPGLNAPFDPIATKKAAALGLTVIIANGNKLDNLDDILNGKNFIGTKITD